jgi:hypothetical protein
VNIKGFELKLTCGACPEAYEVFVGGRHVGYLGLRHGTFNVIDEMFGEVIYTASPKGDGLFDNDIERNYFLNQAVEHFVKFYLEKDLIVWAGCHDCKTEKYILKNETFCFCENCSPHRNKFFYVKKE